MKMTLFIIGIMIYSIIGISQSAARISISEQEKNFTKTELTKEELTVFENRAKQKVLDFSNYIQLLSNDDTDKKLREHLKGTAIELFKDSTCLIYDSVLISDISKVSIKSYLDYLVNNDYHIIKSEISDLEIFKQFTESSNGLYKGTISFNQIMTFENDKGVVIKSIEVKKIIEIVLVKNVKKFGSKEKVVWEVKLYDLRKF